MPVKRRRAKARKNELTELDYLFLTDALTEDHPLRLAKENGWRIYVLESNCKLATCEPVVDDLWARFGEQIVCDWIVEHPGTRPSLWWRYDAPQDEDALVPRKRLGGTGTANHDVLNYVESFRCGVPDCWTDAEDMRIFGGPDFEGVLTNPNDPPLFESQAAYLGRFGLMEANERRRLKPKDFEPERIVVDAVDTGDNSE